MRTLDSGPKSVHIWRFHMHVISNSYNTLKAHPGQVITRTVLASLVAETVTVSIVPLNGFKKCGITYECSEAHNNYCVGRCSMILRQFTSQ